MKQSLPAEQFPTLPRRSTLLDWLMAQALHAALGRWPRRALRTILGLCGLIAVVAAYARWQATDDWLGLAIRTLMLLCIGLVVATWIEIRLMPWRFLE